MHRLPAAVVTPASIEDVVKIVQLANRLDAKIAMNGNGHSCFGHSQVDNGIVVRSAGLKTIQRIEADGVLVDAGTTWSELVTATLSAGLTPPVMAEFQDLSVGGTLSVGGLGGASHRFGAQIDHVSKLDAVTGAGELVTCSAEHNGELFHSLLAGFGQSGLIVRARIQLATAPTHVVMQNLTYRDLGSYVADALRVARDERFDHQLGRVVFEGDGQPVFVLEVGKFYAEPAIPDVVGLTTGLRFVRATKPVIRTYWAYLNQRSGAARPAKGWFLPHATLYLFLPAPEIERFLTALLAAPSEYAGVSGPMLFGVYPLNAGHFSRPLFQIPRDSEQFFAVYLFRTARDADGAWNSTMLATNRSLYERARTAGGKQYPVTAMPFTTEDWKDHFGPETWQFLRRAKQRFDPRNVLTPGPGIFASSSVDALLPPEGGSRTPVA
ncbi:MAG: FAD-binding protein [Steroidobacteraceae bacterium]